MARAGMFAGAPLPPELMATAYDVSAGAGLQVDADGSVRLLVAGARSPLFWRSRQDAIDSLEALHVMARDLADEELAQKAREARG